MVAIILMNIVIYSSIPVNGNYYQRVSILSIGAKHNVSSYRLCIDQKLECGHFIEFQLHIIGRDEVT